MNTLLRVTQNVEGGVWKDMFAVSERWASEAEFSRLELDFFGRLIDKHFKNAIDKPYIERARSLAAIAGETRKRNEILLQDIQAHMRHVAGLFENPFASDAQACKDEHGKLENRVANFAKDLRSVKQEAFSLGALILESDRFKHLLNA